MSDLLFGHHPAQRLVAVHPAGDGLMRLYFREPGRVRAEEERFYPFFHLSSRDLLKRFTRRHWIKELSGPGFFRYLCVFEDWSSLWEGVRTVMDAYGGSAFTRPDSFQDLEDLHLITDQVAQYLMQTGRTLFKGMVFDDLVRLQLDIETYTSGPHRFSNPRKSGDRIILIALSDTTGWEHMIDGRRRSEASMLQELVEIIRERDPDVIEGHNILGFDLPYLITRAGMAEVPLELGRDGSAPVTVEGRTTFADQPLEFTVTEIAGRHVIDTLLLVQGYDASRRSMESYGLKYAARFFGLSPDDRTYVDGEKISWYWDNDPATLVRYAFDDVRETRALAEHLSGSPFYLTQMVPAGYGPLTRSGSAAKIESLLQRAYLRARQAMPRPGEGSQTSGGYTDVFVKGMVGPVVHADVESLYPSIMLTNRIAPVSDSLGVFLQLLEELTSLRLEGKRAMHAATDPREKSRLDAIQGSLKILINSFYGYLGYTRALFNDFAQADRVTTTGQQILRKMMEEIRANGGTVVEVDTDGVLFVPPQAVLGEQNERTFVALLSSRMPRGITVAFSGRYPRMVSFRKKNYALLTTEGRVSIKGSSLVSRSMEGFGRSFIRRGVELLLQEDIAGLHALYLEYYGKISEHKLHVREFARVETLKDQTSVYTEEVLGGKRNRSAAYEVALAQGRAVRPGERIAFYITGSDPNVRGFEHCRSVDDWNPNFPDENTAFYLRRLNEFAGKFEDFFSPQHFHEIFSPEGLFPFDPSGIRPLVTPVAPEQEEPTDGPGEEA
ncbi:MAG TPA: DNA polymerase domain-containing protein [Bacteroidota bacterium]